MHITGTKSDKITITCDTNADARNLHRRLAIFGIDCIHDGGSVTLNKSEYARVKRVLQVSLDISISELMPHIEQLIKEEITDYGISKEGQHYYAVVPQSIEQFKSYWVDGEDSQPQFNQLAQILSDYLVNTPYHKWTSWYQFSYDGYVVFRPNHDVSHSIRQYFFAKKLKELTQNYGSPEFKAAADALTAEETACIELAAFLFRAGRTNEYSWDEDLSNQNRSRDIFKDVAKKLGFRQELIEHISFFMTSYNKLERGADGKLTTDDASYNKDGEGKPLDGFEGDKETKLAKAKITKRFLDVAHHVDLQRCWNVDKSPNKTLIHDNTKQELEFLLGSKEKASLFTKKILNFAADCTEATGNKLIGNVYIGYDYPTKDNKKLKAHITQNVGECINNLEENFSIDNASYKMHQPQLPTGSLLFMGGQIIFVGLIASTAAAVCVFATSLAVPLIVGVAVATGVTTASVALTGFLLKNHMENKKFSKQAEADEKELQQALHDLTPSP